MNQKKKKFQIIFFAAVMALTFYAVLGKQDFCEIWDAIKQMSWESAVMAMALGLFFVSSEGMMIWYLLSSMGNRGSLQRCIQYSFIGFFYSGVTPSATGGQPMQLYYMKKDGYKVSDSSVILMTVALAYKLVLVFIGLVLLLLWYQPLAGFMGDYIFLYFVGIILNVAVILVIIGAMAFPDLLVKIALFFESIFIKLHIWKENKEREEKIRYFAGGYRQTVKFMAEHKGKLLAVFVMTLAQRCSMFLLTYVVYRGFHLFGESMFVIMSLQAAVYIAVDMLPVPGAQGITELVYQTAFTGIFTKEYLLPSMLVSRGMNFYFLLVICGIVAGFSAYFGKSAAGRTVAIGCTLSRRGK